MSSFACSSRSPFQIRRTLAATLLALVLVPAMARAQESPKLFGIRASFAPEWKGQESYKSIFGLDGTGTINGSDLTIGFARGTNLGGEWGVSYIRKKLKTDGIVDAEGGTCGTNCSFAFTETSTFDNVYLDGVEAHFSIPFVTIKRRVQVGLSLGFGAGFPKGTVHQVVEDVNVTPGPGGQPITQANRDEFDEAAKDVFFPVIPIVKVEAEVGVILAPGLKVRAGGGFNFPSQKALHMAVVYLFGAK